METEDLQEYSDFLLSWDRPLHEADIPIRFANDNSLSLTALAKVREEKVKSKLERKSDDIDSQISYIEKCMPNWKHNFPWVCWCKENRVLYCLHCKELLKQNFPEKVEKSNVFHISASEGIFSVAKMLRIHHNKLSHIAAIYLYSCSTFMSFVSLFNEHFKAMKTEDEVIEIARSMFDYPDLKKDGLIKTVNGIGKFIEQKLIESVAQSEFFSVVADQCRGIVILRWVNEKNMIVEHVLWSYLSTSSMTPMQYLKGSCNLDMKKLSLYIANSLCQHCSKCEGIQIEPAALPPRPPSTLSFVNLLWKLDFLRPIHSLIKTIYGLFQKYPYKFVNVMEAKDFKALSLFDITPISAIKVMEKFDVIKTVALDIYSKESVTEALGVAKIDLKNDEQHKKILMLLQEIINTTKSFALTKISVEQIVKLNQAFGSLKTNSAGASFLTHSSDNSSKVPNKGSSDDKIWEFLTFVEKFIDENQKSIYYNGKTTTHDFLKLFKSKLLLDKITSEESEKAIYPVMSNVLKVYINRVNLNTSQRYSLLKNLITFYSNLLAQNMEVNSCLDVLRVINENPRLISRDTDLYKFFLYCATMPFLNCHVPRSLFVSFIVDQRVESSIWARLDPDLKQNILYLQNDMHIVGSTDLLTWWYNLIIKN